MMRKLQAILLLTTMMVFSFQVFSQDTPPAKPKPKPKEEKTLLQRMSIGGYLGAQFGSVINVDISPMVYFEVTPSFYTGLGLTYLYFKDNRYQPPYSSSGYGGSVMARYHVWKDLFVQAEYDPLSFSYYDYYDQFGKNVGWHKETGWAHDLLIGAGYRQWIGGKAFASFSIFYNVNETNFSPYRNPIIRIGFGVGF